LAQACSLREAQVWAVWARSRVLTAFKGPTRGLYWMAKLLSHHDKFHVHAILGLTALLHFFFRFAYLFGKFQDSFTPGVVSALTLGVHVLLHASSFQFALPKNRLWTKPMIWREFRIHNAIFAYRHLIGAYIGIWLPEFWWRSPGVVSILLKVALIFAACKAADVATEHAGSEDKRTTNAMPYPQKTANNVEQVAKWFYAKSQFAATSLAAFGTPSLSFLSVLAIEIASFLMTLVRKGIIETRTYHIVYAASLFIMFPAIVATLHSGDYQATVATFRALCVCFFACEMRMNYKYNKYLTWAVSIAGGCLIVEGVNRFIDIRWAAWPGMAWSAADTLIILFKARTNERLYSNSEKAPEAENVHEANDVPQAVKDHNDVPQAVKEQEAREQEAEQLMGMSKKDM